MTREIGPMPRWKRLMCAGLVGATSPLWIIGAACIGLGIIGWHIGRALVAEIFNQPIVET